VESAERALALLSRVAPDVISMDVRLPGMDGIEATRRIMEQSPTPIVIVAADCQRDTVNRSMEALRAGALTVMEKPVVENAAAYGAMARRLCDQFVNMSGVKVVRQRFNGMATQHLRPSGKTLRQEGIGIGYANAALRKPAFDLLAVTASTGGPAAVAKLLQGLGGDFPVPVLVVQHMAENFLPGYADWLNAICGLHVRLAQDCEGPLAGRVYVAPGSCHLCYRRGQIRLVPDRESRGHIPSGDVLFHSLAAEFGARAIGVLLTGKGEDGARGLLAMRQAGAHTIAQDRATSAVFGMPAAAWALGGASEQLPIGSMAYRITELVRTGTRVSAEAASVKA
jgi:two-component system chemotaxis response regulator CheB